MAARPISFAELVERHRGEILAYARRLLGHEQDAQDVCQDALMRACRAFGRLPRGANARAWLYKITTNTAFNAMRRGRKRKAGIADVGVESLPAPTLSLPERGRQLAAVRESVDRLPRKQRAALMQRYFQGLDYGEIAVSLGCSEASARANVYQAIKKLRVVLGGREKRKPPR
jgi:RNA polymerase sigma-70 factor (ECF subfamily)